MEIRTLDADDLDAAIDVRARSFGPLPAGAADGWRDRTTRGIEARRVLAAYEGSSVVAMARVLDLGQWWMGRQVPMAGVAGVVVAPEHRGRGVGTGLMTAVMERATELGYPISALYPATLPPYRAVGYEIAGAEHKVTVDPAAVRRLAGDADVPVRRATADDVDEALRLVGDLHERHRDCGPLAWPADDWADELADEDNFTYLAEDGFLMYGWDGSGGLQVHTVAAGSEPTARTLWSLLGSASSVVRSVSAVLAPHDPLRWLLPDRGLTAQDPVWWMLRALDVRAAVAGRGFPAGVRVDVPVELDDPQLPANAGRYRLVVDGGAGALEPDRTSWPALRLGPNGFAALFAGTPVATLRRAGLATGGRPGDDAELDAAFAGRPFMLDYF